jgi:hypothetical protein
LCWSTSWFFGFGWEERWKTVGRAMMTSQELSFVKWNYFLLTSVSAKIQCIKKYALAALQRQVSRYSDVCIAIPESAVS